MEESLKQFLYNTKPYSSHDGEFLKRLFFYVIVENMCDIKHIKADFIGTDVTNQEVKLYTCLGKYRFCCDGIHHWEIVNWSTKADISHDGVMYANVDGLEMVFYRQN